MLGIVLNDAPESLWYSSATWRIDRTDEGADGGGDGRGSVGGPPRDLRNPVSSGVGSFPRDMEDAVLDGSRLRGGEVELVRMPDAGPVPEVVPERTVEVVGGAARRGSAVRVLGSGALLWPSSSDTTSAAMRVP